jgi:pyrimidine operon attenuation protein / uracil phosphoribosyltransferase
MPGANERTRILPQAKKSYLTCSCLHLLSLPHNNMQGQKVILENERFRVTIERLCLQLWEDWESHPHRCIVGIQPRGIELAQRIHTRLSELTGQQIPFGILDITFYRDDFRMRAEPLTPHPNVMDFVIGGKHVLLVDDVLYTGRTIQAAMSALQHYGRPDKVELLALVDRRFNRDLPVQASYVGLAVDALEEAYVRVDWQEQNGEDKIVFFDKR